MRSAPTGHAYARVAAGSYTPVIVARRFLARIRVDWRTTRFLPLGILVMLAVTAFTTIYFFNTPVPYLPYHDSFEYLASTRHILAGQSWVNPQRMPGYPAFLALIFHLRGYESLKDAEIAQLGLFVLTAVEVYVIGYRVWRNSVVAACVALLMGSNLYILEYVKPILSDGLALWLTTTLALAVVLFIERPRAWTFWFVTVVALVLFMTRAEWYLVPIPLFAYLVFVAWRQKRALRIIPHVLVALALLFAVAAGYMSLNVRVNGFYGLTSDENINLYGKVTQYNMQNEAPPRFATIAQTTNTYVTRRHIRDPWVIYWSDPQLGAQHFARMGAYARAIILAHPLQFLADSVPVGLAALPSHRQFDTIDPAGLFAGPLQIALAIFDPVPYMFLAFPLCAVGWWIVLLRARKWRLGNQLRIEQTCALVLLAVYDLAVTTLGSYNSYRRLHLGAEPLMLLVVVGSAFSVAILVYRRRRASLVVPSAELPTEETLGEAETRSPSPVM